LGENQYTDYLLGKISSSNKNISRGALIALAKLGQVQHCEEIVDLILGSDETEALNVCYLTLRFEKQVLNEHIISQICQRGTWERSLAFERYSRCGGFCREQLELLQEEDGSPLHDMLPHMT